MQRSTRVAARIARNLSRAAPKTSSTAFGSIRTPVKSSLQLKQTYALVKPLQARFFSSNDTEDVPVPSMGDSISEGTVVEWLKSPGDAVAADDVVVVLETDKVSVDVRSPYAGVMGEHLAGIDDNVTVGSPLFRVTKGEAPASSPAPSQPEPAAASSSPVPSGEEMTVEVPSMGDSISEGTIVSWMKGAGDAVAADDVVVVIETDKVSVDVRAPTSGTVVSMLAEVDQTVEVGKPLFTLQPGEAPSKPSTPDKPAAAKEGKKEAKEEKKEAKEPEKSAPSPPKQETPVQGAEPLLAFPSRQTHTEKMSRMRLRTAERLKESQNTSASLTTFQEVDMTNLMAMRKKYKDAFEDKHGVKLGFMSAFIKASSSALLEVPGVNAMIDEEHQEIVYRDFVDMSVAVSTPKGLVTPVLRNTESMGFADIEKAMGEMAIKARDNKLTLEELSGGNFTISNGGVFGSLMGTPIINVPQSGILGMHGTKMRPVVLNGEVVARPMMYLALTYDHRLIDGREAVTCLKSIADKVEDPERLLLDL